MRYDRGAVSPWAFFLPVALAIIVGNLVSDAIDHALRDRFEAAPVPAPVVTQAADPAPAPGNAMVDVIDTPAAPMQQAPMSPVAAPVAPPHPDAAALARPEPMTMSTDATDTTDTLSPRADAADSARRLSGPITARQAGESESCINGTVAIRSPNGWEQALENDAPVRCEASSN